MHTPPTYLAARLETEICSSSLSPARSTTAFCLCCLQVKADVLPYCKLCELAGAFLLPSKVRLAAVRVVVATCGAAGILHEGVYTGCSFTHVMIDEAGQVWKFPCLPLVLARSDCGTLVETKPSHLHVCLHVCLDSFHWR